MNKPLISVIIVNFNGERYLNKCVSSVLKSYFSSFEILLVDDGSTDKSLEIMETFHRQDSKIILLRNKINLGAAASRNIAISKAKGSIIVFLDNDTEVTPYWLDALYKSLIPKEVGAAQALLIDFNKRDVIQMAGGKLISYAAWLVPIHQGRKYESVSKNLTDYNIIAVSGAMAVKKEVLRIVKNFDEKEAIYTEDLDFSWRIWIAGYHIVLSSNSVVYHYTKSVNQRLHMGGNYFQIYFNLSKNSLRSMIKNYELRYLLVNLFIFIALNFGRGVMVLIRKSDFSALSGAVCGLIWNLINMKDTLRNRKKVQQTRRFSDHYLYNQIFTKDNIFQIYNKYFKRTKLLW